MPKRISIAGCLLMAVFDCRLYFQSVVLVLSQLVITSAQMKRLRLWQGFRIGQLIDL
jgi:hypothetical protein